MTKFLTPSSPQPYDVVQHRRSLPGHGRRTIDRVPEEGDVHRIAVVDDDITFVEMLTEVLALEGYAVTGITSAADARATLSAAHPDLILLDLRMEQSDSGSHLLGELERDAALRGVPIVVCTADLRQVEALRPQLDARGVSILLKPFDLTTLFECVQRFLPPAAAGGA